MKGCAPKLALKKRHKKTRKWPVTRGVRYYATRPRTFQALLYNCMSTIVSLSTVTSSEKVTSGSKSDGPHSQSFKLNFCSMKQLQVVVTPWMGC